MPSIRTGRRAQRLAATGEAAPIDGCRHGLDRPIGLPEAQGLRLCPGVVDLPTPDPTCAKARTRRGLPRLAETEPVKTSPPPDRGRASSPQGPLLREETRPCL